MTFHRHERVGIKSSETFFKKSFEEGLTRGMRVVRLPAAFNQAGRLTGEEKGEDIVL